MIKWLKFTAGVIVFGGALLLFIGFQCQGTRIVMYHSLKPNASLKDKLTVSTHTFRQQMELLDSYHYNVIPLEALAILLREKKPFSPKTIAITFDDTNEDAYLYAFPVLKAYGFAATVFVVTEYVGKPYKMTWDEIRRMQKSKLVSVGSHTITHSSLKHTRSEASLKREIADSKTLIEKMTGQPVTVFSYPFGECNAKLKQIVRDAGYSAAVVSRPWSSCAADAYALRRIGVSEGNHILFEVWLAMREFYIGALEFFKSVKSKLTNWSFGRKTLSARGFAYNVG